MLHMYVHALPFFLSLVRAELALWRAFTNVWRCEVAKPTFETMTYVELKLFEGWNIPLSSSTIMIMIEMSGCISLLRVRFYYQVSYRAPCSSIEVERQRLRGLELLECPWNFLYTTTNWEVWWMILLKERYFSDVHDQDNHRCSSVKVFVSIWSSVVCLLSCYYKQ